jgi:hypothetical protein
MKKYVIDELVVADIKITKKRHVLEDNDVKTQEKKAIELLFGSKIPPEFEKVDIRDLLKDPFAAVGDVYDSNEENQ